LTPLAGVDLRPLGLRRVFRVSKAACIVALFLLLPLLSPLHPSDVAAADTWSSAVIFENNGWIGGSGSGPIGVGHFDPRQYTRQVGIVAAPGGLAALFEATSTYSSFMFNDPLFQTPGDGLQQYAINCIAVGKVDGRRPSTDVILFADDWSAYEAYWDSSQGKWTTELIFTDWDALNAANTPAFRQIGIGDFDSSHGGVEAVTAGGNSGHLTELYYSGGWQTRRLYAFTDQTPQHSAVNVESVAVGDFDPSNSGDEIVTSRANPYQALEVYGSGSSWNTRTILASIPGGFDVDCEAIGDADPSISGNEVYLGTYQNLYEAWWNGGGFSFTAIAGSSIIGEYVRGLAVGDFDPRYSGSELVVGAPADVNGPIYEFHYSSGWQNSLMVNAPYLANGGLLVTSLDPSIPGLQVIAACAHTVRIIALSGPSMQRFKLVYEVLAVRDATKTVIGKAIDDYASIIVELNSIGSPVFGSGSAAANWPLDLSEDIVHTMIDVATTDAQLKKDLQAMGSSASNKDVAARFIDRASQQNQQIAKLKTDARLEDVSSILGLIASVETKILGDRLDQTFDNSLNIMLQNNGKLNTLYGLVNGVTDKNTVVNDVKQAFDVTSMYSKIDTDSSNAISYINSASLPSNIDLLVGSLQDFTSQLLDASQGQRSIIVAPKGSSGSFVSLPNLNNYWKQVQYYAGLWKNSKTVATTISWAGEISGWVATASSEVLLFVPVSAPVTVPLAGFAGFMSVACTLAETAVESIGSYSDAQMYLLFETASQQFADRYAYLVADFLGSPFLQYVQYWLARECPDSQALIQQPISWSRVYDLGSIFGATKVNIQVTVQGASSARLLYSLWPSGTSEPVDLKSEIVGSGIKSFRSPISFSWIKGSYDARFELWVGARRASLVFQHFDTGIFSSSQGLASGSVKAGETTSASLDASGKVSATVDLLYHGSQVDLHVYDSQNHHLGMNYVTGLIENLIPGAVYGGTSTSPVWAALPPGAYTVSVVGVSAVSGGLGVPDTAEPFVVHEATDAVSPGVLAVTPAAVRIARETASPFWFDVVVQESTGQNGLSMGVSYADHLTGPSGFDVATSCTSYYTNPVPAGGQGFIRVYVEFPSNAPHGTYAGTLHIHATGQGGSNPSYDAAIPISLSYLVQPTLGSVIRMSTNTGASENPSIATAGSYVYVAWSDSTPVSGSGGQPEIWLRASSNSGASFGSAIRMTTNIGSSAHPSVAASGSYVYLAWQDSTSVSGSGSRPEIWMRVSSNYGGSFGPAIRMSTNVGNSYNPSVAAYGSHVYVAWQDDTSVSGSGTGYEIWMRASSNNGVTFNSPIRISTNTYDSVSPSVAASGSYVYVAWSDSTPVAGSGGQPEIWMRVSANSGASFGSAIRLSSNAYMSLYPSIAASGSCVYVVWQDHTPVVGSGGAPEVWMRVSSNNGANFGSAVRMSTNTGYSDYPRVAAGGSNVYVTWQDNTSVTGSGGDFEVWLRASANNGALFGSATRVTTNTGSSVYPSVAAYGSVAYVAWEDSTPVSGSGSAPEIWLRVGS